MSGRIIPDWAVDPEIRDIVRDLNKLPFVRMTRWSCAGYGPRATEFINFRNERKQIPFGHGPEHDSEIDKAYLVIEYEPGSNWTGFHRGLEKIAVDVESKRVFGMELPKYEGPAWLYDFAYNHVDSRNVWVKVRRLIAKEKRHAPPTQLQVRQ